MADAPQVDYPLRLGSLAKSVEMELKLPLVAEFIPQGFAELVFVVVLLLIVVLVMPLAVIPIVVDDCPDGSHKTEKRHRKFLNDHPITFTGCCKWRDTAKGVRAVMARDRRPRDFDPGYLWLFGIVAVRFLSPHELTGTETQAHTERFLLGKLTLGMDGPATVPVGTHGSQIRVEQEQPDVGQPRRIAYMLGPSTKASSVTESLFTMNAKEDADWRTSSHLNPNPSRICSSLHFEIGCKAK
ncbi:hypothetical protein EDD18DRAFT_1102652 [Armillaria luteobubalina]|uniref:Uncharacterized protein n=1 Tax=Armillaria luteobubalina TaxID=153913 RepID=A0AA39QAG3_9AGAR|nr:hypothetical protein EDD18DRAFT_1102652 [Armillaria luteobubalina]